MVVHLGDFRALEAIVGCRVSTKPARGTEWTHLPCWLAWTVLELLLRLLTRFRLCGLQYQAAKQDMPILRQWQDYLEAHQPLWLSLCPLHWREHTLDTLNLVKSEWLGKAWPKQRTHYCAFPKGTCQTAFWIFLFGWRDQCCSQPEEAPVHRGLQSMQRWIWSKYWE